MLGISNTRQAVNTLLNLPVETSLIAVDDEDQEYIIESIVKRKIHGDNDNEWCYALKLRKVDTECIKR